MTVPHPAHGIIAMRGLTFRALAAEVGVHPLHLSRVVRGVCPPTPRVKTGLSDALGIPAEILFRSDDEAAAAS